MTESELKELSQSIEDLSSYRARLHNEITNVGKKLRLTKSKIESTLNNHTELKEIDKIIKGLTRKKEEELNRKN